MKASGSPVSMEGEEAPKPAEQPPGAAEQYFSWVRYAIVDGLVGNIGFHPEWRK